MPFDSFVAFYMVKIDLITYNLYKSSSRAPVSLKV